MLKRTPLRVQLVAAVVALVALGLTVTGIAATTSLRSYLIERVDQQLTSAARPIVGNAAAFVLGNRRPPAQGLPSQYFVRIYGADAEPITIATADLEIEPTRNVPAAKLTEASGKPFSLGAQTGRTNWRAVVLPLRGEQRALVAVPLKEVADTVTRMRRIVGIVSLLVLAALAALAYAVVRSSLKPLVEVETTAEAIAAGELSRRVPQRDPRTEVGRLSRSLNVMLTQIESAFGARAQSEAAARASEERMRRFVADASHELRTPLTSIRGFAELYRQGAASSPPDVDRSMQRIEEEATRMGVLVDDLLLLARLDQQRPLERRPVELVALAADAVHDATAAWPGRDVQLRVLPGDIVPVVLGDEARLRQVLSNLVSNAVTHTPVGTVATVTVGADDGDAVLEVSDTGPGLAPAAAARVFERFYRADASRTRAAGGTGLGLSIVAALVAAHGGTVTVETEPGRGATFRVRLPLAATAAKPAESVAPQ